MKNFAKMQNFAKYYAKKININFASKTRGRDC